MRIFAIVNEKGGTAKTTTSVSLSAALGELGKKVLLVDLDGQAASSRWLGAEDDTRFAEALWQGKSFEPIHDVIPNVSLAPGSGKLDSVAHDLRPTQGGQLRKILNQMTGFDYAIIDCPPSLGNRLIGNALLAATDAIVPVETSILALDGLRMLLTTIQDVRDGFGHNIDLAGVVACRYDSRTRLSRMILDELKRALPGKVFHTVIRENVRLRECPASGQSILTYAPDSHAAEDYRSLAREVIGLPTAPATPADLPPELQRDLSGEEARAVRDMHTQVDQMLRHFAPKANTRTTAAAAEPRQDAPATEEAPPVGGIPGVEDAPPATEAAPVAVGEAIDDTPLADLRRLPEDEVNDPPPDETEETPRQAFPPWLGIPPAPTAARHVPSSDEADTPDETIEADEPPQSADADDRSDGLDPAVWQVAAEMDEMPAAPSAEETPPVEPTAPQPRSEAAFYLQPIAAATAPEAPEVQLIEATDELHLPAEAPATHDEAPPSQESTITDAPDASPAEPPDGSEDGPEPPAVEDPRQDFPALRALLEEMGTTGDKAKKDARAARLRQRPVGAK